MKSGPRPVPSHLKLLRGNPSKTAVNKREPQPRTDPALPSAPEVLGKYAAEEWHRVVVELRYMKLLASADLRLLAAYCQHYAIWRQAVETFNATGDHFDDLHRLVVRNDKGNASANPLLGIISKAAADMLRYASEFGLTPSARSRISVPPEAKRDESKFTGLLSG